MQIDRFTFPVTQAYFGGRLRGTGPIEWLFEVNTDEASFEDEPVAPKAYIEQYNSNARAIDEFISSSIQIPDGAAFCNYNILPACRLCCIHLFEHYFLDDNRIQFEKHDRFHYKMTWTARFAMGWDAKTADILTVRIETIADFLGFIVAEKDESHAQSLLASHFDPSGMRHWLDPDHNESHFLPEGLD